MQKILDYLKKKSWSWWLSNVLLIFIIVLIFTPGLRSSLMSYFIQFNLSEPEMTMSHKEIAPSTKNWTFVDIHSKEKIMLKDLENKTVFINVWATWCGPCVAEMGYLKKLYRKMGDQVYFILVSKENPKKIQSFAEERFPELPIYFTRKIPPQQRISAYPTTLIIDNNEIVFEKKGAARWDQENVQQFLQKLVETK